MKLSVITINYNDAEGLETTISSLTCQRFRDFEHIVVDGGSTDESVDVIKRHESFIARWVSEKDRGIYHAQNKGWQMANGEYLLFLNSGDSLVSEDTLEQAFTMVNRSDIVYGDLIIVEPDGSEKRRSMPDRMGVMHLYKDTIWHPASFIKSRLFREYGGYDEHFRIVADYEFFCRMILQKKASYQHIGLPVARFQATGISSDPAKKTPLEAERREVQNRYMNPFLLAAFRLYSKLRK
jgi:glycosyltransferase involved in cell wall biosynthesis